MRISDWSSDVCSSDLFLRTTIYLSAIYCFYTLTAYFLLAWLPQMVTDLGFSPAVATTVSVATNIGGVLGAPLTGFAIRKLGVFRVLATLLMGMGAAVFRSEERRVGKGWGSTCRSRWSPEH